MRLLRRRQGRTISGINITPLTDVALTLLMIFMIATPLIIQSSMKVNLPQAAGSQETAVKPLTVTIDSSGALYFENARITLAALRTKLASMLAAQPASPVIVLGDRDVRYDVVVQVLDTAKAVGAQKLSLGVQEKKQSR
jgi:biopolymer transport protein ExbD